MLGMKRTFAAVALSAAAALVLGGCSSSDDSNAGGDATTTANPVAGQTGTYLRKAVGEASYVTDPGNGKDSLTFTVDSIERASECVNLYDEPVAGEFVKVVITAKTDGLDSLEGNVMSPEKWSAVLNSGQELRSLTTSCVGDIDLLALDETGTRTITAHFAAPASAVALRLNSAVDRGEVGGWEWELPAAAAETTTAPSSSSDAEPPIGFTGASIGDPQPLVGKVIDRCLSDPMLYQRGTTQFTDGTTGWTQQCANGG